MNTTKMAALVVLLLTVGALFAAQAQEHPTRKNLPAKAQVPTKLEQAKSAVPAPRTDGILAQAAAAGGFKTFLAAVEAAGLTDKLQGDGPFTVFAPTDAAFAKLPYGMVSDLLKPANKAKLAGILADHVVPGKLMAKDVKTMKAANVGGHDLDIQVSGGKVTVNGAHVIQPDLVGSNGVIHGIDEVLMPEMAQIKADANKPKDHPAH